MGRNGYDLVKRVERTVRRYKMFPQGQTVLVAVSGGPDSMCLIDVLGRLSSDSGLTLDVAHVDHGLNSASREIAARVARHAAESGYDAHVVRAPDLAGPNLQARARAFRYGFFETIARQIGASAIATGHTLDDRVETTLQRLIHGAGTAVIAGIPPVDGGRARPLIEIRRAETRSYCETRGLEFVDDPANSDDRFERAAVRAEILAPIERRFGDGAIRAMAAAAERLREDADALEMIAARLAEDILTSDEDGADVDRKALLGMHRALRRKVLERAVGRVRDRAGGIEAVLDALDEGGKPGKRFSVAGKIEISIHDDVVRVSHPPGPLGFYE